MSFALYSPEDITILLGGIYQIEGLHEGSFVSISKDSPLYETNVTSDGKVTRTHKEVPTYSVTITTSSVASVNSLLSAWAVADGVLYGAMFPLFIKDSNGGTLFYATQSWIEKLPDSSFGMDVEGRDWVIKAIAATSVVGGNEFGALLPTSLTAAGLLSADFSGLF